MTSSLLKLPSMCRKISSKSSAHCLAEISVIFETMRDLAELPQMSMHSFFRPEVDSLLIVVVAGMDEGDRSLELRALLDLP